LIINIDRFCLNYHNFSNCLVDIDAVNLLSLTCISRPAIQFRIVNPPTSILDSYIAFALNDSQRINQQHVSRCSLLLLSGLTNVKSLTLSKEFFRVCISYLTFFLIHFFNYCVSEYSQKMLPIVVNFLFLFHFLDSSLRVWTSPSPSWVSQFDTSLSRFENCLY
jgi:hypothetical protein